jgi:serine kinase of HPr protein (carbohydrate metabolism regulator)
MSRAAASGTYVHATVVVVGESGVLIRGASGTGKSALALALMAEAGRQGLFNRLVGDDRVQLSTTSGRLTARGHPVVAGLIEERGTGLLAVPHEDAVVVRCIVDMLGQSHDMSTSRMPGEGDRRIAVEGVELPRIGIFGALSVQEGARRILAQLAVEAG